MIGLKLKTKKNIKRALSGTIGIIMAASIIFEPSQVYKVQAADGFTDFNYDYAYSTGNDTTWMVVDSVIHDKLIGGTTNTNKEAAITSDTFTYTIDDGKADAYADITALSEAEAQSRSYAAYNGIGSSKVGFEITPTISGTDATIAITKDGGTKKDLNVALPEYINLVYCTSRTEARDEENKNTTVTLKFNTCLNNTADRQSNGKYKITGIKFDSNWAKGFSANVKLTIPATAGSVIPDNTFKGNTKLKEVNYKAGITSIGANAFYGCTGLEKVNISDLTTSIGASAFYNCTSLTDRLILSSNIVQIGDSAFQGCKALRWIYVPDVYGRDWSKIAGSDRAKVIGTKLTTGPIVSQVGATAPVGKELFKSQILIIKSPVDVESVTVTRDGTNVTVNQIDDTTYSHTSKAYQFIADTKGAYTVKATDCIGNTSETVIKYEKDLNDTTAPVIKFDGIGTGENYQSVTAVCSDEESYIISATLDGKALDVPADTKVFKININETGTHTVVVTDSFGNQVTQSVKIDSTKPVISGIPAGNIKATQFNLTFTDKESGIRSVVVNGVPQEKLNQYAVTVDGVYTIEVTDNALNTETCTVTLDSSKPTLASNIETGKFYTTDVLVNFTSISGIASISVTQKANGETKNYEIPNNTTLTEDGTYTITAKNNLNKTNKIDFTIDKTAPTFDGVKNNGAYKDTTKITVVEDNIKSFIINDKEQPNKAATIRDEGTYKITATDKAGNSSSITIIIDKTAPTIKGLKETDIKTMGVVTGKKVQTDYKKKVTLKFKDNIGLAKILVNKKDQGVKSSITFNDGKYTVKAVDKAGNSTTVKFTIDKTKPKVTGIKNNKKYKKKVKIKVTDAVSGLKKVTIDGKSIKASKFKKGYTYKKKGKHTLVAEDKFGNKITVKFTIK